MGSKKEIYQQFVKEYPKATKEQKSEIITSIVKTTKVRRKSVIRRMKEFLLYPDGKPTKKRGRKPLFGIAVTAALKTIWEVGGEVCGILLFPLIKEHVTILKRDEDWKHSDDATEQLVRMSEATVRRRVLGFRKKESLSCVSSTSPSKIKTIVPVYAGSWRNQKPGSGQIDTVVHCGPILAGNMAYTLTFVDVTIGWVVLHAQWNKSEIETTKSVQSIEEHLPWPVLWLHSDSGGEFIQWDLVAWTKEKKIRFTRCRRGKKNDNEYVEERNGHVVRKWVGDARFDCQESVDALNAYYETLMLLVNHFLAIRKTKTKSRVNGKYIRTCDAAQTPYQRALAHPAISEEVKEKLKREHATLSPLRLTKKLATLRKQLFIMQSRHGDKKFRNFHG